MLNTYLFADILLVCAIMIFFSLSSLVVPRLVPIYNDNNFISLVMLLLTAGYVALIFNAAFPRPTDLRGWRKVASTAWRWSKPLVFTIAFGVALIVPTVGCYFWCATGAQRNQYLTKKATKTLRQVAHGGIYSQILSAPRSCCPPVEFIFRPVNKARATLFNCLFFKFIFFNRKELIVLIFNRIL